MEEYIKILENFINKPVKSGEFNKISNKEIQAIENLLKRYKELIQENKSSKETINILTNKLDKVVEESKKLEKSEKLWRDELNNICKNDLFIPKAEIKEDLEYMKKAKAPGVKRLLMKKGIIGYLEKLLERKEKIDMSQCWLCNEIKKGIYKMENTNKTVRLKIYREDSGKHLIQAEGEDVLQQEIIYCPMCRWEARRVI